MNKFMNIKFIVPILLILIAGGAFLIYTSLKEGNHRSDAPRKTSKDVTAPDVQYDTEKSDKMLLILKNRPTLSPSDKAIRDQLISSPNPIIKTKEFSMEYIPTPDQFQVEILSPDVSQAKANAVAWLTDKGLSKDGICYLPITFYLNYDVSENLRGQDTKFNPIPEGC